MKILQINSVCGVGSTGRIATDLHAVLKTAGHESMIAYGRDKPLNCDRTIKIGKQFDVYMHVAKTRFFDRHGFGSKNATRKLIKEIEKYQPDLIHLHNLHGYYLNVEILFNYLKKLKKLIVWTLHDCWAFTGHCAHFEYAKCTCWQMGGDHHCIQKKEYPTSWWLNNSKNNYKRKKKAFTGVENLTIVTPSEWLASYVKQSFLKEYPIKIINNGIDLDIFKPQRSDFEAKNKLYNRFMILGVTNSWNQKKGLDYFLELAQTISWNEVIVLVGLSEEQKLNLPSKILGITRTDSVKALAEIYATADVFVNPTLEDSFPTTNLEALASGTPVITFDTGGSPESVTKDVGFVTKQGDLEALIKKINQIKRNGKIYYSKKARNRAETFYDKNDRFNDYLHLYQQLA